MKANKTLTFTTPTDIVVTDPAYFVPDKDWAASGYGEDLPFPHITASTGVGDGEFLVIDIDSREVIGTFTADTAQTTVASLDDIIEAYGPALADTRPECYTVIRGFTGVIRAEYGTDGQLIIMGEGRPSFTTRVRMPDGWNFDDMGDFGIDTVKGGWCKLTNVGAGSSVTLQEGSSNDAGDFDLEEMKGGYWRLTDVSTGASLVFMAHHFNDIQRASISGDVDVMSVARVMRRMGDWLSEHRPDLI